MAIFAGQYHATIDDKGRVVLPSAFKKAVGEMELDFVVVERNRRNKCLDIHTVDAWKKKWRSSEKNLILKLTRCMINYSSFISRILCK